MAYNHTWVNKSLWLHPRPDFINEALPGFLLFLLPPGGFFVFGILIAIAGKLSAEGKAPETMGCAACPLAASCSKVQEKCEKEGGKA